jgi:hypothetical protein
VSRTGFRALLALCSALAVACAGEPAPGGATAGAGGPAVAPALSIEREPVPGGTRLLLIARPGTRLNAATRPVLELANGTVVHFDTSAVTADSLYYSAPPAALLPGEDAEPRGTLRASVCDEGALVCRRVQVEI